MLDALCTEHPFVDFFPDQHESTAPAKAICRRCLVLDECLAYALELGSWLPGIWGATTQRERHRRIRAVPRAREAPWRDPHPCTTCGRTVAGARECSTCRSRRRRAA